MQAPNPIHDDPESAETENAVPRARRRLIVFALFLLVVLLLVFVPPLISVNRFQRRIATNISTSLGRPVHFKSATLSLLPLPGVTLEDFVVEEDPAFGAEPTLQADEVHATLRLSSLWSHRIEFSTISLTDPSVNLVHTADGQWNLQSILFQAAHIQAAPTDQHRAGPAPRFPYIEATGARLNLKLGEEKIPYSLTDADFALWLPEPHQWHFRLEAHPVRTDTSPADAGTLHLEGTLGNAANPAATLANLPIDLQGSWQDAQLAGVSRLVLGRDAGLWGDLNVDLSILGSLSHAAISSHLQLAHGRRADFVPPSELSIEASCQASAENTFHAFSDIECYWPPADSSDTSTLIVAAAVPDIYHPALSSASVTLPALPAATFLDWLRVATPHPPTGLTGPGTLAGTLTWHPTPSDQVAIPARPGTGQRKTLQPQPPTPIWSGELEFSGESLQTPALGPNPIPLGDVLLRSTPLPVATPPHSRSATQPIATQLPTSSFDLLPITLPLGGKQPATLEGHFDATGYTLHLTGAAIPARLFALADAIPQFGDGLRQLLEPASEAAVPGEAPTPPAAHPIRPHPSSASAPPVAPISFDLTATRTWGGPQTWRQTQTTPPPKHHPATR